MHNRPNTDAGQPIENPAVNTGDDRVKLIRSDGALQKLLVILYELIATVWKSVHKGTRIRWDEDAVLSRAWHAAMKKAHL